MKYSYYGDWVSLEDTPGSLVSSFYYYYDVHLLSQMATMTTEPTTTQVPAAPKGFCQSKINQKEAMAPARVALRGHGKRKVGDHHEDDQQQIVKYRIAVDGMVYENSRTCNDGPILYMQEVLV